MSSRKRISISPDQVGLQVVWDHYESARECIIQTSQSTKKALLSGIAVPNRRFTGMTLAELEVFFDRMLEEADAQACLFLLAAAESALRVDFLRRIYDRKPKDEITLAFRKTCSSRRDPGKVRLDQEILETWVQARPTSKTEVSELRGAFNYRHWLAHGRYWIPKLGRKYDPTSVFPIIKGLFNKIGVSDN